jgi:flagellar basal body-associated protein FliL
MRSRVLPFIVLVVISALLWLGCGGKDKIDYIKFGKPFIVNAGSQKSYLSVEIVIGVKGKVKDKEKNKVKLQAALINALVKILKGENDPKSVTPKYLEGKLKDELKKDTRVSEALGGQEYNIYFTRFVMQ